MSDKLVIPFQGTGKVESTAKDVYDMFGNKLPFTISGSNVDFDAASIGGVALSSSLSSLSSTEIGYLDGTVAGTQAASKVIVNDANSNQGAIQATSISIGTSGAEVLVTSTPAELNYVDTSVQTETITAAGAVSVSIANSKLALVGAGAVTLAAPSAAMYGRVKIIEMTVDNGDVTLALTNIQGQSSGTTATFNDVGDTLVLVAGTSKWNVVGEAGVTLA